MPGWIALVDTSLLYPESMETYNRAGVILTGCALYIEREPYSLLGFPFHFIYGGNEGVEGKVFILPFTKSGHLCGNDLYINPFAFFINWVIWFFLVSSINWVLAILKKS